MDEIIKEVRTKRGYQVQDVDVNICYADDAALIAKTENQLLLMKTLQILRKEWYENIGADEENHQVKSQQDAN